jgi:DNA-binding MarR family transcriptional regulator
MESKPKLIFLLNSAQRHLQQWIAQQTEAASRDGGAMPTPAQSGVLFVLARHDGCTMGDLAQALDLAPSAISGLVQRMEAQTWVMRQPCAQDGRTQRVWLQAAGRHLLPTLTSATRRIQTRLSEGFTAQELKTVARWLTHVQQLDQPSTPER